ncbi:MAG: hypothetical protein ABI621_00195 [Chloroflexota bacterium]
MIIGSMKEVFLTRARDIFLFDCRVGGLDAQALNAYHTVLSSFIRFTGDVRVKHLKPNHVGLYIANLSDGPHEGEEYSVLIMIHHDIIQTWIHWMYSQNFINERMSGSVKPPRLADLFPLQFARSLTDPYQGMAWCA